MEIKRLNLRDALELASILEKYIDEEKTDALDFMESLVNKLKPKEYLHGVILLTGATYEEISDADSMEILSVFIKGLQENKIISLVLFYRSLGKWPIK